MRRQKMQSGESKKLFTRTAKGQHPKNTTSRSGAPMRGGIRL